MFHELKGQRILAYEVFEPWCQHISSLSEDACICGAVAIEFSTLVLTISSRIRFSGNSKLSIAPEGLSGGIMDIDTWRMQRHLWQSRTKLYSPMRQICSYRETLRDDFQRSAVSPLLRTLGLYISDVTSFADGNNEININFHKNIEPMRFRYSAVYDGGLSLGLNESAGQFLPPITNSSEYAWLHPATPIPVQINGVTVRSALFEDWPLFLRRTIFKDQELPTGEPLRRTAQLLTSPVPRQAYLDVVCKLMSQRFEQHPHLQWRLAILPFDLPCWAKLLDLSVSSNAKD